MQRPWMKKQKTSAKVFDITEKPLPLTKQAPQDDGDTLCVIEQNIRDMMHQIADAGFAQLEEEKRNREKLKRLFLSIIEAMDAFDRVFHSIHAKQDLVDRQMKKWIGNFRTVRRLLNKVFSEQGVIIIENLDQGFDPSWHKVSDTMVDPSKPDGTIVEEVLKGYLWNNQVLRKSEVVVVRNEDYETEEKE